MEKIFDPGNGAYKTTADLPESVRDDFEDVAGTDGEPMGFVRYEANTEFFNAEDVVQVAKNILHFDLEPTAVLHAEAEGLPEADDEFMQAVARTLLPEDAADDPLDEHAIENPRYRELLKKLDRERWVVGDHRATMEALMRDSDFRNELEGNREFARIAFQKDGFLLSYVPRQYQNDKELALIALRQYPESFKLLSNSLKQDSDVIRLIVARDVRVVRLVSDPLRSDIRRALSVIGDIQTMGVR